jgi:hypothetical protein
MLLRRLPQLRPLRDKPRSRPQLHKSLPGRPLLLKQSRNARPPRRKLLPRVRRPSRRPLPQSRLLRQQHPL